VVSAPALLGGVLSLALGWSAVFFVNVPIAGLAALAALRVMPPDGPRGGRLRLPPGSGSGFYVL
jgi:predicted MFS family arabinose efflux permease